MDIGILQDIMKERGPDLLGALKAKAGFSPEQAQKFLPEAGAAIGGALSKKASDLDLSNLASAANISAITNSLDIGAAAKAAGVPSQQGLEGMKALLPLVMGFLSDRAGGAGKVAELLGGSDALGKLKGLGRGLFGQ